jgi:hypothetical protein
VCATGSRERNVSMDCLALEFEDFSLDSRRLVYVPIEPHASWTACVSLSRLLWSVRHGLLAWVVAKQGLAFFA